MVIAVVGVSKLCGCVCMDRWGVLWEKPSKVAYGFCITGPRNGGTWGNFDHDYIQHTPSPSLWLKTQTKSTRPRVRTHDSMACFGHISRRWRTQEAIAGLDARIECRPSKYFLGGLIVTCL